jgi:hypothetical protein
VAFEVRSNLTRISDQRRELSRYLGETDANAWLVRQGWAVAYRKYSQQYVGEERLATNAGRGIWQGRFVSPDKWRKGERLDQQQTFHSNASQKNCSIKGNISKNGERIYHLPGMKWYGRTRIDERKGERWFCSEAAAKDAGWRKAL